MKRYLESRTSDVVSKRPRTVDRLQEAEQDVVEAKQEIKQMKDKVPQLELEIKQMKDKVAQSEQKVAQSEQKVAQSVETWKKSPNRMNERLMDQANEQLKQANEQLKQANEQLKQANEQLKQANEQLKQANERLDKAEEFNRACILSGVQTVTTSAVLRKLGWTEENWKKQTPVTVISDKKRYSEFEYQFRDRDEALKIVKKVAQSNFNNRLSRNHKEHAFLLVPGMSSIGKTRLGHEAPGAVRQLSFVGNVLYAFIDLNNGEKFSDKLDGLSSSARLGVRLAATMLGISWDRMMRLPEEELEAITSKDVLDMVIRHHLPKDKDKVLAVVIHIDEYTFYIDDARRRMKMSYDDARSFYKDLLREMSRYMREGGGNIRGSFFIVPLCSGTSPMDIRFLITDDRASEILELTPLSAQSGIEMFLERYEDFAESKEITKQEHFQIAISDTMCVPGIIDWMISGLPENAFGVSFNWSSHLYSKVSSSAASKISAFGGNASAECLLYFAFSGQAVSRDFVLPGGLSVGDVERNGVLFLEHSKRGNSEEFKVLIPFVYCRWLNNQLGERIMPDGILCSPTPTNPWLWQNFEELHLHFLTIRINSLLYALQARIVSFESEIEDFEEDIKRGQHGLRPKLIFLRKELNKHKMKSFSLSDVLPGVKCRKELGETVIFLREVGPYHENVKFLIRQTSKIEPFSLIKCVEQASQVQALDGVFLAASDNALFDGRVCFNLDNGRRLVVLWQDKHSKLSSRDRTVSCKFISEWYRNAYETTGILREEGDEIALLFFTNRSLRNKKESIDQMILDCPRLLLITEEEIRGYLTPTFAHRGVIPIDMD